MSESEKAFEEEKDPVNDLSENEDQGEDSLEAKLTKELDRLMDEIEKKTTEIEEISQHNTELNQEVQKLQSQIMSAKIVNKTVSLNSIRKPDTNNEIEEIDESAFNNEHKDLLNEMRNKINETRLRTEENNGANEELEKEVLALISQNSEFERDVENFKMKIKHSKREQKMLEGDIQMKQNRLKAITDEISEITRAMRAADASVLELTNRKETLTAASNSKETLLKEINSLTTQSQECQVRIDMINASIADTEDQINEINEKQKQEDDRLNMIIGWDEEKKSLVEEKNALKEELDNLKKVTAKSDAEMQKLQKRYNGIRVLAKKWGKTDLSSFEEDAGNAPDIDVLLARAIPKQADVIKSQAAAKDAENQRRQTIEKLESKINSLKGELERKLVLFRKDEQSRISSIDETRKKMFDTEDELITKIQETNIKIAQKKQNNK